MSDCASADPEPLKSPLPPPQSKVDQPPDLDVFGDFSSPWENAKDLIIVIAGCAWMLVASVILFVIEQATGFSPQGFTLWLVVPIGAFFCGMVAGIGYWAALRWLDRLPTRWAYASAFLLGAVSFVLVYVLGWWFAEFQGVRVHHLVGFPEYLKQVLLNQRMVLGHGGGGGQGFQLGVWAFPLFALDVVGYVFGIYSVIVLAGGKQYCPTCKRYYKNIGAQIRSSSDPEATAQALHPVIFGIGSGRLQEAVDLHAASGGKATAKDAFTSTIVVEACPGCGTHKATLGATIRGNKSPVAVENFSISGTTHQRVAIAGKNRRGDPQDEQTFGLP